MSEEKTKVEQRPGGIQRDAQSRQDEDRFEKELRVEIKSIREGHNYAGYVVTEALQSSEKLLHKILDRRATELEAGDHSQKQQAAKIRRELAGFCYKPKLVVAQD